MIGASHSAYETLNEAVWPAPVQHFVAPGASALPFSGLSSTAPWFVGAWQVTAEREDPANPSL